MEMIAMDTRKLLRDIEKLSQKYPESTPTRDLEFVEPELGKFPEAVEINGSWRLGTNSNSKDDCKVMFFKT